MGMASVQRSCAPRWADGPEECYYTVYEHFVCILCRAVRNRRRALGVLEMARARVCADADIAVGQMDSFEVDGLEILVARDSDGVLHAFDGSCPHEDFPLIYGDFDGTILVCGGHMWCFDVTTGRGINPPGCHLAKYLILVEGDDIYVDRSVDAHLPAAD